jgi:lysophospholipase L1-like esterase
MQDIMKIVRFVFLLFIAPIFIAFLFAKSIQISTNTLYDNGKWVSQKVQLARGVIGGVTYMVTPRAVWRGYLDIAAWHGNQELYTKEYVEFDSAEVSIRLREDTGFIYILLRDRDGFRRGIRISRDTAHISSLVHIDKEGKFLLHRPLDVSPVNDARWHIVKLVREGNSLLFFVDHVGVGSMEIPKGRFALGFRGSPYEGSVDSVSLVTADGRVLKEDFENKEFFWFVFLYTMIAISLCNLLFLLWNQKKKLKTAEKIIKTNMIIGMASIVAYIYAIYMAGFSVPSEKSVNWRGFTSTIETSDQVQQRVLGAYSDATSEDVYRIMLIGSSQTWGAGASSQEATWARDLEKVLENTYPQKNIEVINLGISGMRAEQLYELYENSWISKKPDMVMIILGNNDDDSTKLVQMIEKFLEFNSSRNILTVLVAEPVLPEEDKGIVSENHMRMKRVAQSHEVHFVNMQEYMNTQKNSGLLWWDRVHLTDWGQRLFSRYIFEHIAPLIQF